MSTTETLIKWTGKAGTLLTAVRGHVRSADSLIGTAMALFYAAHADGLVKWTAADTGTMTWAIAYVGDDGQTVTTKSLAGGLDEDNVPLADSTGKVFLISCKTGSASKVAAAWKVAAACAGIKPADGVDLTTHDGALAHVARCTGQRVTDKATTAMAGPATVLMSAGKVKGGTAGLDKAGKVKAVPGTLRHAAAAAVTGKTSNPSATKTPTGAVWCGRMATMHGHVSLVDWSDGDLDVAIADVETTLATLTTIRDSRAVEALSALDPPVEAQTS